METYTARQIRQWVVWGLRGICTVLCLLVILACSFFFSPGPLIGIALIAVLCFWFLYVGLLRGSSGFFPSLRECLDFAVEEEERDHEKA